MEKSTCHKSRTRKTRRYLDATCRAGRKQVTVYARAYILSIVYNVLPPVRQKFIVSKHASCCRNGRKNSMRRHTVFKSEFTLSELRVPHKSTRLTHPYMCIFFCYTHKIRHPFGNIYQNSVQSCTVHSRHIRHDDVVLFVWWDILSGDSVGILLPITPTPR